MILDISYQNKQYCMAYGERVFKFDQYMAYKDFLENCFLEGWGVRDATIN